MPLRPCREVCSSGPTTRRNCSTPTSASASRSGGADPGDDLISRLVEAADEGDRLSEDEVVAFVALLLVAGHETTANMLGNGLVALWRNPAQLARWREEPEIRAQAVGGASPLRHHDPDDATDRHGPLSMSASRPFLPGRLVLLLNAAANRDPRRFSDPDRLDLTRDEGPSMAFGFGIHHCLGASLARAELTIGLGALTDRLPALDLGLGTRFRWRKQT